MISATIFVWVLCFGFAIPAYRNNDEAAATASCILGMLASLGTICLMLAYLP